MANYTDIPSRAAEIVRAGWRATAYALQGSKIRVVWRGVPEGLPPDRGWAVTECAVFALSRGGTWTAEPLPSSHTDEYLAEHRFTLDEALDAAERWAVGYPD